MKAARKFEPATKHLHIANDIMERANEMAPNSFDINHEKNTFTANYSSNPVSSLTWDLSGHSGDSNMALKTQENINKIALDMRDGKADAETIRLFKQLFGAKAADGHTRTLGTTVAAEITKEVNARLFKEQGASIRADAIGINFFTKNNNQGGWTLKSTTKFEQEPPPRSIPKYSRRIGTTPALDYFGLCSDFARNHYPSRLPGDACSACSDSTSSEGRKPTFFLSQF